MSVAHAIFFVIAFPPVGVWPAALVALMPLVAIVARTGHPGRAAFVVWIVASFMWLFLQRWLVDVTAAGWPLLAMYLAAYPALFVWVGGRIARRMRSAWTLALALAVLWTGLEMLRGSVVLTGYAWFLIAHPLIDTPIAQLAEFGGVYGVSLIVAFGQCLVALSLLKARGRRTKSVQILTAGGVVAVSMMYGSLLAIRVEALQGIAAKIAERDPDLQIAVVQTNVPQSNKIGWPIEQRLSDFARMRELTLEAARGVSSSVDVGVEDHWEEDGWDARPADAGAESAQRAVPSAAPPDLIIWPETMFPGDSLDASVIEAMREAGLVYPGSVPATAFNDAVLQLQQEVGAALLVGALGYDGFAIGVDESGRIEFTQDAKFNSAFLIENGAVSEKRYDKLHLTPFGEVMPIISRSEKLEQLLLSLGAPGMAFDLEPGAGPVVFEVKVGAPSASEGSQETQSIEEGAELASEIEDGRDARPTDARADDAPPFRIVTPICFEAATPSVCRRLVFDNGRRRADLMVNLTNDGWFGDFAGGRAQHLQVARWRCIELRTPMVRAANTGVSAAINTVGRVQACGPDNRDQEENVDGVMRATVLRVAQGTTLYARIGDLVGWVCVVGVSIVTIAGFRKPRAAAADALGAHG